MLRDPPVAIAPDEHPRHSIWTRLIAIGTIDVPRSNRNIRSDVPNQRHWVGFYTYACWTSAEIAPNGIAAVLQFIDRAEQHGVLEVECHVPVEVMAIEGFQPRSVQTFDGWCCGHGILDDVAAGLSTGADEVN